MDIKAPDKFYRYTTVEYAIQDMDGEYVRSPYPNPKLILTEYNLHKETPKGYWIGFGFDQVGHLKGKSIWVSKTSKKRFAYPSKEQAMINFVARNERRLSILKRQVLVCEIAIDLGKNLKLFSEKV